MINKSIWISNIKNKTLPSLKEDITCDILIVGGGMAGLSTAYHLKDADKKIVLIDMDTIGYGATSKNTGKLTFMQDLIYNKIENNYNKAAAKAYLNSQKQAITTIVKIINDNKINCHLTKTNSYVFSNDLNKEEDFNKEVNFYRENNIKYKLGSCLPLKYPSKIVLETYDSYIFNPYEYLVGLKNILKDKITIYEKTRCISIDKDNGYYLVKTIDNFTIKAKQVVCTTHYPIFIIPFMLPFKSEIERFFIGAAKSNENKDIQIISHDKPSISMRYYLNSKDNFFLYGRRSHASVTNLDFREDYKKLKEEYQKYFNKDLEYFYHTHDIMTYDSLPFIGRVDENLYIATGFNKWGNTNGTISGVILSGLLLNKENKYEKLFNPKRSLSKDKIKNLTLFNLKVGTRYIINKINPNMKYYDSDVEIKFINGKRCGIYTDKDGIKHIISNICPHMKCNLIFNYIDKTWDCPCHASKFSIDGEPLMGPSVYDIKIK